jgi:serine/threonine-protein kinase
VSPANVLISNHGTVKLTDFGVAKLSDTKEENTGFKGKYSYAAPERLAGSGSADGRMDVYSAGIVLFETVTLCRLVNCESACMEDYRSGVPTRLQQIVDRAIHSDPDRRFQSAAEMRRALLALRSEIDPGGRDTVEDWHDTIRELRRQAEVAGPTDPSTEITKDTVFGGINGRTPHNRS